MATLADFRTAVSGKVGLDNSSGSNEQLAMDRWANEGVRDVLLRTKCYVVPTTLTPGAADYNLLSAGVNHLAISDIIGPDLIPLERIPVQEIDRMRYSQSTSTPRWYAFRGANLISFFATPGASDAFTIYYVPRPTEMTLGTHDPSNATYGGVPLEYHKAIEYYTLWQAGDYDDDASSHNGADYKVLYEDEIKRFRKAQFLKGGRTLGSVIGGALRRPYIPPTNDIDVR